MESSGFEQDDPFGEGTATDPFGEEPGGEESKPVVDREGNEVADANAATSVASDDEEAELEAAKAAAEEAGIDSAVETASEVASSVVPPPADDPASSATQKSDPENPSSPAAQAASAPATPPADDGPTTASATQEPPPSDPQSAPTDGDQDAPSAGASSSDGNEEQSEAEAPKPTKGKRAYRLFTPESVDKFTAVTWFENKKGEPVPKGTSGAKKQSIVMTADQEGALRFGWQIIGSPQDGCPLVAVADSQWTVRHVSPDPVQPVRQRLKIR